MIPNYDFLSNEPAVDFQKSNLPSEPSEFRLVCRGEGPLREKYRPQRLNEVVPTCSKEQLTNIVNHPTASQVYLLEGRTGTGKTTCARILAKAYVCLHNSNVNKPCLECDACKTFDKSYDVTVLNAANQNKIEDIRTLVEDFRYKPNVYKYKIFILDEVQRLTDAAQQVLLTELEEPPSCLLIFMCTTEASQLEKPLVDRATKITFSDLRPVHARSIIEQVISCEGGVMPSDEVLLGLYERANGSIRALLNNIQDYLAGGFDPNGTDLDESMAEVGAIFKCITEGKWPELANILKKPNVKTNAESLRMGLENYFRAVLLTKSQLELAHRMGEAMLRLSGSMHMEPAITQYNQFVIKCLRACYVFRSN